MQAFRERQVSILFNNNNSNNNNNNGNFLEKMFIIYGWGWGVAKCGRTYVMSELGFGCQAELEAVSLSLSLLMSHCSTSSTKPPSALQC